MTNVEEKVLAHVLSQPIKDDNAVDLGTFSYSKVDDVSSQEYIDVLQRLDAAGYVEVRYHGYKNVDSACRVILKEPAMRYFAEKKNKKVTNLRDAIRVWTPIIISLCSLAVSVIALLISLQSQQPVK